ncbi:hypothetical protein LACWKB10_0971 [Lactobacillus sp. wkB10]|nr:hypothetical protein LACWKB10_0971 [Lactobacillus sp. wkB10]
MNFKRHSFNKENYLHNSGKNKRLTNHEIYQLFIKIKQTI